jgi:hypothetical protein
MVVVTVLQPITTSCLDTIVKLGSPFLEKVCSRVRVLDIDRNGHLGMRHAPILSHAHQREPFRGFPYIKLIAGPMPSDFTLPRDKKH